MNDVESTSTDEILDKDKILEKIRLEDTERRRKIRLNVSAPLAASVIPFTKSPDRTVRWAINGICFEPAAAGGVLIIATDLKSIVVRHDSEGLLVTPDDKPLIISPFTGQTKTLHPVFGGLQNLKPYSSTRLLIEDDKITQEDGRPGTYDLEPLLITEQSFPQWRGSLGPFLRAKPYQASAAFPANMLARFDFQPKSKPHEAHAVLLWQEPSTDPTAPNYSPIFVTSPYPDSADMIGAFMPVENRRFIDRGALNLVTPHRQWITDILESDPENPSTADSNGKLAA